MNEKQFQYDKNMSLELARAQLEAMHPDAHLFYDKIENASIKRYPLTLLSVNKLLSNHYWGPNAGFALGKLHNFYGMESTGKTALAAHINGDILRAGGRTVWDDVERSFDNHYMSTTYGVDVHNDKNFHLVLPAFAEEAFDAAEIYARTGGISLITIDSVTALGTQRTHDAQSGKDFVGELPRRIGPHFEKIVKSANDNQLSVIYINQLRDNIIQMGGMMKAAGKKFAGGNAMKFYPHVAVKFTASKGITDSKGNFIGTEINLTTTKNKTAKPFESVNLLLIPGEGFSKEADLLTLGVQTGVVKMKGAWYQYDESNIGQGINQARLALMRKPELYDAILTAVLPLLEPEIDMSTGEILMATQEEAPKTVVKKSRKTKVKV